MIKKEKKPTIRFKDFSDNWKQTNLGEIVSIKSGFPPSSFCHGKMLYVKVNDLNHSVREQNDSQMRVSENIKLSMIRKGSTIFPKRGAAIMTNKVRIMGENGYLDTNMMALDPEGLTSDFLYLFISGTGLYKIADTSTIPQINNKHIQPYEIQLPSIEEQKAIGSFFKNLDNLITLQQRKIKKLKNVKKAMLEKMFPKKGCDVPEIRFKGFSGIWQEFQLEEIVELHSGRDYKHLSKGSIPVYGTGGYMLSVSQALSYEDDAIGIGRKGTIDNPYIIQAPFWTVDTLFYAVPKINFDLNFIFAIFQNIDWKKMDESTGVPSLSKNTINHTRVLAPTLDEQKTIGKHFKHLNTLIALHQKKLTKLRNIKNAFLEKMFI